VFALSQPFAGYAIEAIREIPQNQNKTIPILIWMTTNAGSTLQICKPEPSGKLETRLIRYGTAEEIEAILPEVGNNSTADPWYANTNCYYYYYLRLQLAEIPTGKVISTPGIPPMYDYEGYPQEVSVFLFSLPFLLQVIYIYPAPFHRQHLLRTRKKIFNHWGWNVYCFIYCV
jgi:hypothetical protein